MNNRTLAYAFFACIIFFLAGCEVIGGIFKTGFWAGILLVVLIIALIVFVISRAGKK